MKILKLSSSFLAGRLQEVSSLRSLVSMEMFTAVVEVVRGARDEQRAVLQRMSSGRRLRVGSPDVMS